MKPAQRRGVVAYLQSAHALSQRRACQLARLSRKAANHRPDTTKDAALIKRLKALGERYPRYGYLMMHALLKREGLVVNRKRTYRLYSELGIHVLTKRRKKLVSPRIPMVVPTRVNERRPLDLVHDPLSDGTPFRLLHIVADFSR